MKKRYETVSREMAGGPEPLAGDFGAVELGSVATIGQRALAALRRIFADWRRRSRYRAELARMSECQLRDIGVGDKATVTAEVRRSFWRPPSEAWHSIVVDCSQLDSSKSIWRK